MAPNDDVVTTRHLRVHVNCVALTFKHDEGFNRLSEWDRVRKGLEKLANVRILDDTSPPTVATFQSPLSARFDSNRWFLNSLSPMSLSFDLPQRLQEEHSFPVISPAHRPESFIALYDGFLLLIGYTADDTLVAFDQGSIVRKYFAKVLSETSGQPAETVGPSPLHIDMVVVPPTVDSFSDPSKDRVIVYHSAENATPMKLLRGLWFDCSQLLHEYYRLAHALQCLNSSADTCVQNYSHLLTTFQNFLVTPFWRPLKRLRLERALYDQMTTLYAELSRHSLAATALNRDIVDFLGNADTHAYWRAGVAYFKEHLRISELRHDILLSGLNYVQAQAVGHGQIRMRFRAILLGALIGGAISILVAWLRSGGH